MQTLKKLPKAVPTRKIKKYINTIFYLYYKKRSDQETDPSIKSTLFYPNYFAPEEIANPRLKIGR